MQEPGDLLGPTLPPDPPCPPGASGISVSQDLKEYPAPPLPSGSPPVSLPSPGLPGPKVPPGSAGFPGSPGLLEPEVPLGTPLPSGSPGLSESAAPPDTPSPPGPSGLLVSPGTPVVSYPARQRQERTFYNSDQVGLLEKVFQRTKYPNYQERVALAEKINVQDHQVQVWTPSPSLPHPRTTGHSWCSLTRPWPHVPLLLSQGRSSRCTGPEASGDTTILRGAWQALTQGQAPRGILCIQGLLPADPVGGWSLGARSWPSPPPVPLSLWSFRAPRDLSNWICGWTSPLCPLSLQVWFKNRRAKLSRQKLQQSAQPFPRPQGYRSLAAPSRRVPPGQVHGPMHGLACSPGFLALPSRAGVLANRHLSSYSQALADPVWDAQECTMAGSPAGWPQTPDALDVKSEPELLPGFNEVLAPRNPFREYLGPAKTPEYPSWDDFEDKDKLWPRHY
ncbi:uncharacterized protein LOC101972417 isoform X1 [Ictidomys tridecemlineatus]